MPIKLTVEPETHLCNRLNREVPIEKCSLEFADKIETYYYCGCAGSCADSDCKMTGEDKSALYVELT